MAMSSLDLDAPRQLDGSGKCCRRKPLTYKRPPHLFCTRCDAADTGIQVANWAWIAEGDNFRKVYP